MSIMSSLSVATSGLRAAQSGLSVTGHNMANSVVPGYVRQRVLQKDFIYQTIGHNPDGVLQVGLGTDVARIQQIRDNFIDITYRQENSKGGFYLSKATTGREIESILGELQSRYNAQSVFHDLWNALNELSVYQPGLETRANFVSTAVSFLEKADTVYNELLKYQKNLDGQIRASVTRINEIVEQIAILNQRIAQVEMSGDRANDFRDTRNVLLDELSGYLNIEYKETPKGTVDIMCEGRDLLLNNLPNKISLKYCAPGTTFIEPVFTGGRTTEILAYDAPPNSYYTLFDFAGPITAENGLDKGSLKGLLVSRGFAPANYATNPTCPSGPLWANPPDPTDGTTFPGGDWANAPFKAQFDQYLLDLANYQTAYAAYNANPTPNPPPPTAPRPPRITNNTNLPTGFETAYNTYTQGYDTYEAGQKQIYKQYQKEVFNVQYAMVPKMMKDFDTLVHSVITLINDAVSPYIEDPGNPGHYIKDPNAPYGLDDSQYMEVFVRKYPPYDQRFNGNDLIPEDPTNHYSLYTLGNVMVNPDLLNTDGYNMLAFSLNQGDVEDTRLVLDMMEKWKSGFIAIGGSEPMNVDDTYKQLVSSIGNQTQEAMRFNSAQHTLITQIENKRQSLSGVSLDEEMTSMLKYQHAYNASARVINTLTTMFDTLITMMR